MTLYAVQNLGANISQIVSADDAQDEAIRSLERGSTEPTVKVTGLLHNATPGTVLTGLSSGLGEAIARWNGSAWTLFADPTKACINNGGTIPFAADQPMGGRKLTGLGAGTTAGDSVRYEQALLVSGSNAMAADLDMGTHKITNVVDPTSNQHAATKKYVDDALANIGLKGGAVTTSSNSAWTTVSLGFDYSAVMLVLHDSNLFPPDAPASGNAIGSPSWVVLGTDGTGEILLKYGRMSSIVVHFKFQKTSGGFQVKLDAGGTDTLVLRYVAIK